MSSKNLRRLFSNGRIVAIAGDKSTGKSNNIVSLIKEARANKKSLPIYCFGFDPEVEQYLKNSLDCKILSCLEQLVYKKDCLLVLDEFWRLKLNDRRYKDLLQEFTTMTDHNNIYVILCSAEQREYNKVIGAVVNRWAVKSLRSDQLVNGSQLKYAVEGYKGKYKSLKSLDVPKSTLLLLGGSYDEELVLPYIEEADNKKGNKLLF